jgi:2-iminobutanoate/2-iminopropanoate deaminase
MNMAPPKHFLPPAGLKTPPLSFATRSGDILYVSGIPGFDETGALPPEFSSQFELVVRNLERILAEAGAVFADLIKVNVLLTRRSDVARMNELYGVAFGPPPYPARTTSVVLALPDPAMLIEIECIVSLAPS